jgi:hypothetical protein
MSKYKYILNVFRVHPETKLYALRDEIEQQLGTELVPREYVFVKSVGRSLTRVSILTYICNSSFMLPERFSVLNIYF